MLLSSGANTDRKISDQVISKLDTIVLLGYDVELSPQVVYLAAAAHVRPT